MASGSNIQQPGNNRGAFDPKKHPLPDDLKQRLDVMSRSISASRMKTLDLLDEKDKRLYAFMTYYEGNGFCWVQPTRTKSYDTDAEYDNYIRRVNNDAREDKLDYYSSGESLSIGMDVVAQYEVDGRWYRAMIVGEPTTIDAGQWSILFSDFGNLQLCNLDKIRKPILEPDCDHFRAPLQAVCCRLYNLVANSAADQEKIDTYLGDFCARNENQFLEMYVRNIRPDRVIDCDLFTSKRGVLRRHIARTVVDEGMATFVDPRAACAIKAKRKPLPDPIEPAERVSRPRTLTIKLEIIIHCSTVRNQHKDTT